jgi:hypothetical protein
MRRWPVLTIWMGLVASGVGADEAALKATASALVEKYGEAVVTVQLVVKTRLVFQGQEHRAQEAKLEIGGTVMNAAGLTVLSDSSSNPTSLMGGGDGEGPRFETETTDVRILLRDGRELPARFVLRDQDLDLAFVMPDEKGLSLPYVPLEAGPLPALLDDLLFVSHLGRPLNREVSVSTGRVRALVRKPRTFVVSDLLNGLLALGSPAFDVNGRPVGLVVMRRAPQAAMSQGSFRDFLDVLNPVILTCQDVLTVADQAAKSAADEKK